MLISRRSWFVGSGALLVMGGPGPAWAADDIVVGVAGPFSGPNAAQGEEMRHGVEVAAQDINTRGGVLGRRIRLEFADDASDPKQGVAVAGRLVGRKVAAVLGHMNSGVSIPASAVYAEADLVMVSPAATNPALTDRAAAKGWTTVFRTIGRDDAQGTFAGRYIARHFAGKRMAIVHDKTAFGKGIADETRKALNGQGITEVAYDSVTVGEKDFSALITALKGARVDVIYYGGLYTEAGLIVRQAKDQGLKATLVAGDGALNPAFWEVAGASGEGTLMTFAADPQASPTAAAAVERLKARGANPGGYTLYSYAALEVIVAAIARAGSLKTDAMAKALRDGRPVDTVAGPIAFDHKGDVKDAQFVMFAWSNGRYKAITE